MNWEKGKTMIRTTISVQEQDMLVKWNWWQNVIKLTCMAKRWRWLKKGVFNPNIHITCVPWGISIKNETDGITPNLVKSWSPACRDSSIATGTLRPRSAAATGKSGSPIFTLCLSSKHKTRVFLHHNRIFSHITKRCTSVMGVTVSKLALLYFEFYLQSSCVVYCRFWRWVFWPELQSCPFNRWYRSFWQTTILHHGNKIFYRYSNG